MILITLLLLASFGYVCVCTAVLVCMALKAAWERLTHG